METMAVPSGALKVFFKNINIHITYTVTSLVFPFHLFAF